MKTTNKPNIFILILLISFGSIGAVLISPALPAIATHFDITSSSAQAVITIYLAGYALGQLLYGPIANGLGRKWVIYIGVCLEVIGALLCYASSFGLPFWVLLVARFIMALGASCGLMISFTIIADCYQQRQATKLISLLILSFAIVPGLAMSLGGFLTQYVSWEVCFLFLAFYGVALLLFCIPMPETSKHLDKNALKIKSVIKNYANTISDWNLIRYALIVGGATSIIYIFAGSAPFIAMNILGLRPDQFGLISLLPSVGMISGSFLSAYLAHRIHGEQSISLGIIIASAGILLMLICFILDAFNHWTLVLPMIIVFGGLSLIFANCSSLGVVNATDKPSASSTLNFINMGSGVISTFVVSLLNIEYTLILPITFLVIIFSMFILSLTALRNTEIIEAG